MRAFNHFSYTVLTVIFVYVLICGGLQEEPKEDNDEIEIKQREKRNAYPEILPDDNIEDEDLQDRDARAANPRKISMKSIAGAGQVDKNQPNYNQKGCLKRSEQCKSLDTCCEKEDRCNDGFCSNISLE